MDGFGDNAKTALLSAGQNHEWKCEGARGGEVDESQINNESVLTKNSSKREEEERKETERRSKGDAAAAGEVAAAAAVKVRTKTNAITNGATTRKFFVSMTRTETKLTEDAPSEKVKEEVTEQNRESVKHYDDSIGDVSIVKSSQDFSFKASQHR